jgi:hypothetical protein
MAQFHAAPIRDHSFTSQRLGYCRVMGTNCVDGSCYVSPVSAGTLGFDGLAPAKVAEVGIGDRLTIPPDAIAGDYTFGWDGRFLQEPSEVTISATGGAVASFQVAAEIPVGLDQVSISELPKLSADEDFDVSWNIPDPEGYVRLAVPDCGAAHQLVCDAPDTGAFVVSSEILRAFLQVGTWTAPPMDADPCAVGVATFERYRQHSLRLSDGNQLDVIVANKLSAGTVFQPSGI